MKNTIKKLVDAFVSNASKGMHAIGTIASTLALTLGLAGAARADHVHCLCGASGSAAHCAAAHDQTELTWTEWTSTTTLPDTAGNWYLTNDVTLAAAYTPVTGVNLCLNGHVVKQTATDHVIFVDYGIAFALTDCDQTTAHNFKVGSDGLWTLTTDAATTNYEQLCTRPAAGSVIVVKGGCLTGGKTAVIDNSEYCGGGIRVGGDVSVYGGNLIGNFAGSCGGGVYVSKNETTPGTFTMSGGSIVGNRSNTFGGGCSLNGAGTVKILGGNITHNIDAGNGCGGVEGPYTANNSVTVGGNVRIAYNATSSGAENNLYIYSGYPVAISTDTPLTNNAAIGVFTETKPGAPVAFTSNGSEDDLDFFTSDEGYFTQFNTDHLELVAKIEVLPTSVANTTTKVYVNGEELASEGGKYYVVSNSTDEITIVYTSDSDSDYFFADKTTKKTVTLEAGATATDPATMPAAQIPAAPTEMPSVTVSFVVGEHGEQIPDQQVAVGGKVYLESEPEDEDYNFLCWCREADLINAYSLTNEVTSAMTLYAAWGKKPVQPVKPTDEGWTTPTVYNGTTNSGVRVNFNSDMKDLFIGNDFIELGMHRNGAFGTLNDQPSNFHADSSQPYKLGLRSSKSGWEQGDDPKGTYVSDFFLPGTVDEGWMIAEGSSTKVAGRFATTAGDMNGKNLSGDPVMTMKVTGEAGTTNETVCVKTVVQSTQGYEIEQVIVLAKEDTGYDTWITIRNQTDAAKNNVAYYRAFDPDQGQGDMDGKGGHSETDNFYHTEPNGDVYVLAAALDTGLDSPTTLVDMFGAAKGAFFFFAPLFDFGYTVTPVRTSVGWGSYPGSFSVMTEGFHEYDDKAMGIRLNIGTIPAHGEKTLYYYSSLDPDTIRALEKLSGKGGGFCKGPVLTSANVTDDVVWYESGVSTVDVTLYQTNVTNGKIYLATKKCSSFEELATAENQLVPGKVVNADGTVSFALPATEVGPCYAYYVTKDNSLSLATEFYVAEYKADCTLTFDANGGTFADGSSVSNVVYTRWTKTSAIEDPVPPSGSVVFTGWYTNIACKVSDKFTFGERLADSLTLYAGYRERTGLIINGKDIAVDLSSDTDGNIWAYDEANHVWRVRENYNGYISGSSSNTTLDVKYPNGNNSTYLNGVTVDAREMSVSPLVQSCGYLYLYGDNSLYSADGIPAMTVTNRTNYGYKLYFYGSGRLMLYPGEGADALLVKNVTPVIYAGPTFNCEELKQYVYGVRTSSSCCAPFDNGDGTWTAARANWIVFDQQGIGETVTNVVKYYSYFTVPETPTAEGYTFAGWYKDSACTQTNTSCYANAYYGAQWTITLYAKWNADVVFDAAGGQFADGTLEKASPCEFRSTYVLPTETPVRANYTFLGWYAGVTNNAPEVTASTSYSSLKANVIYAKWESTQVDPSVTPGTAVVSGGDTADGLAVTNVKPTAAYADGNVVIPDRTANDQGSKAIVSIADAAFTPAQYEEKIENATPILSVTIPTFVTEIGRYAFYGNSQLSNLVFSSAYDYQTGEKVMVYVKYYAFANTAITNVTFPAGGSYKLGSMAFAHNKQLKDVWILGDVTIESLNKTPFYEVGEDCGGTTFHLSPKKAADSDFVRALTNGVNMASVEICEEVAGEVEVDSWNVTSDPIVATFSLSDDAPWKSVTTDTVSLLYYSDASRIGMGEYTQIFATKVEKLSDNSYRAEFPKPATDAGTSYFTLCVGD